MGAIYLQSGVCLLPKTDDHVRRLKIVENEIREAGGESLLLDVAGLDSAQEERVIARFNGERDEAYREFLERCEGFEGEIARESAAGKFTYAELEENDEDLTKLRTWFEKIRKLDFYNASLGAEATKRLEHCAALLESFSQQVFDAQDENHQSAGKSDPAAKSE